MQRTWQARLGSIRSWFCWERWPSRPHCRVAAEAAPPLKVVQIGDSYSAGNGAGNYYGPKDCYRSSSNWAERYLDTLRATYNVKFVNRACSGGVIDNLTDRRRDGLEARERVRPRARSSRRTIPARAMRSTRAATARRDYRDDEAYSVTPEYASHESGGTLVSFECARYMEPQIDAVGQDTDIVLLTIGGNDVDFSDIVKQCFVVGARRPGRLPRQGQRRPATASATSARRTGEPCGH